MRTLWAVLIVAAVLMGSSSTVVGQADEMSARPPIPSAGCGVSTVEPGSMAGSLTPDLLIRRWKMRVPPAHDGETPVPLVILLHGGGASSDQIAFLTEDGFSDEEGFVAVAPQGFWYLWMWESGNSEPDLSLANSDLAFMDALIDHLSKELCIDLARVYATGFSWGGVGVSAMGCALTDRIAAIAAVGGMADFGMACEMGRAVPVLTFHSTLDPVFPFGGGLDPDLSDMPLAEWPGWRPTITERSASIGDRYGCEPAPTSVALGTGIEHLTWACPAGDEVHLVMTTDEGHGWPGSDVLDAWGPLFAATDEIDATEMIWDFFEQHPMPE